MKTTIHRQFERDALSLADRRRYERVIDRYLADCYKQRTPARVSELAIFLDANRPYLSKTIVRLFGKPLGQILRERQFTEACRLLTVTSLGLDEIAAASAFGHRATFYRAFRREFGMTPTEFREKATKCDFTSDRTST